MIQDPLLSFIAQFLKRLGTACFVPILLWNRETPRQQAAVWVTTLARLCHLWCSTVSGLLLRVSVYPRPLL